MAYTVFESTNMASTKYAERILDAVSTEDIENGTFGYLDGLADGEDVTYNFVKGFKAGSPVVVVDQVVWDPDNCKKENQRRDKFINKAGTKLRVRVVKKTDEFAVSAEGFTDATRDKADKNKFVTIDSTTGKLVVSDTTSLSAAVEGKIMRKHIDGSVRTTVAHNYGYSRVMYEIKIEKMA